MDGGVRHSRRVGVMKTGQVFVSHTSDMATFPAGRSFVQAVLDAVGRAGLAPVDMRYFAAREGKPADYCRQRVRDCEIYVAVVGFRYGSLVPGEVVSYTELEFDEAGTSGLPRLVFLLDGTVEPPAGLTDVDRGAGEGFRQRLRDAGLIVRGFTSETDLELEVFHALTEVRGVVSRTVPRQLPAAVPHFAGRVAELAALSGLVRERADAAGMVVISAIGGTAGVGKTALAVYWAHRVAGAFPDGQLYVNLRGFDPSGLVLDPADAIRGFLNALEVPPQRIPVGLDAQAALYRSLLSGRRMLVVLDNARDAGQVRPLLPGTPRCLVLVTSRSRLPDLIATDGAHPVALDLLTHAEARELLTCRLGPDRLAAEPQAVEEIINRCARLPLALAIVAARAATHPHFPLHTLAAELRDTSDRLDALTGDDPATDVRAVFSWSYHTLTPNAARLFRLLGLHPGVDISAAAAASLAGLPAPQVRAMLAELARAHLIGEHTPGRYTFHDLLRAYAAEQAHTTDPDDQRRAAIHRMLDHYLHTAHTAARLLAPHRDPIILTQSQPGVTREHLADYGRAMAWFTTEHPVLLAAAEHAAGTGLDTHTWQLAWALADFLARRGHWHDQASTQHAALDAARRLADPSAQGNAHRDLARAYTRLGRSGDAHTHLRHALDLYGELVDRVGQADTHLDLSAMFQWQDRYRDALGHSEQALVLFQAAGHRRGQAEALNCIGWFHAQLGDHQQALTYCQQALITHQELGDHPGQAAAWDSLGYAHHHLGHHTQAITCYQHALDLFRDLGDRYFEAATLIHIGSTHQATGDRDAAREIWQRALTILDDLDHPDAEQVRAKLNHLNQPGTAAQTPNSNPPSHDAAPA